MHFWSVICDRNQDSATDGTRMKHGFAKSVDEFYLTSFVYFVCFVVTSSVSLDGR